MDLGGIHPGWYVGTTWWNLLKEDLRRVAKKYEKEERQDKKARLNLLMMTQEHIAGKVERGSLHHLPELRKTQKEICHWFEANARKVILHGRIRDAVDSEKTRIYHHEKLFKTFERNKIDKLQLEGEIIEGHDRCAKHLDDEVRVLLGHPAKLDREAQRDLLAEVERVFTDEDNAMLEAPVTDEEIKRSLSKANQKASPGGDGDFFTIGKWPPLPPPRPPLHEVFFCADRLTLEPDLRLRFFKKGK